jgi:hypothetical protein
MSSRTIRIHGKLELSENSSTETTGVFVAAGPFTPGMVCDSDSAREWP